MGKVFSSLCNAVVDPREVTGMGTHAPSKERTGKNCVLLIVENFLVEEFLPLYLMLNRNISNQSLSLSSKFLF